MEGSELVTAIRNDPHRNTRELQLFITVQYGTNYDDTGDTSVVTLLHQLQAVPFSRREIRLETFISLNDRS